MPAQSDPADDWSDLRAKIIGLGERSIRKRYYPELERRLGELERFRTLLDQSNDLIFLAQIPSGRLADVNESACRQLGYPRETLRAMSVGDLVPESIWAEMAAFFTDESQIGQEGMSVVTVFRGASGEMPVEMSLRLVAFRDAVFAVIVARDITERLQAEIEQEAMLAALRESEEKYRWLFELESDAIFLIDNQTGQILEANPAASTMYGYSREELLTKRNVDLSAEPQETQQVTQETQVVADQVVFVPLRLHRKKDGTVFPVEITGRFFAGHDRSLHIAAIRDISARQKASEALRESEERYRSLMENVPIGVYRSTPGPVGRFLMANPAFLDMFGLDSEQELKEMAVSDLYVDRGERKVFSDNLLGRGSVTGLELRLKKKDGTPIWGSVTARVVYEEGAERVAYFDCAIEDITARKRAEKELVRLKEFNEGIIQNMVEAIVVLDAKGTVAFANPATTGLLGYAPQELVGQHWTNFVPPDQRPTIEATERRRAQGQEPDRYELQLVNNAGRRVSVLVSASPQFDAETGQPTRTTVVLTDISERVQAEEQIRRRTDQLEALHQVGIEIAAQLDLDALLHSIVSRAVELVGGIIGGFYLCRPEQGVLEVVVAVGVEPTIVGLTLRRGEGLAGRVWQSGQPLVVDDYQYWEGRAPIFDAQDFRATVGVPVRWSDEFLGVLDVVADAPGLFSTSDAELLSLFATQAAIAIQNARLFQEAQQRLKDLTLLFETSASISSSLDADAVLQAAARQITAALAVDGCAISFWDRDRDALVTLLDHGLDPEWWEPEARGTAYPLATYTTSRQVLTERQPRVIQVDEAGADKAEAAWMAAQEVRSLLMVPLVVRDQAVGLLELMECHQRREFTPVEIRLCQTLANQAAAALENARLFQAEREQRETAEELREAAQVVSAIAQALNATTDLASVFQVVARHLGRIIDFDRLSVALAVEGEEQFAMYALAAEEGAPLPAGLTLPLSATAAAPDVLAGRPHVTPDLAAELDFAAERALYESGLRSRLNLPLRLGETIIGALNLVSYQTHAFSLEQLPLLKQVADAVAAAVQNARLYEETAHRNRELALLNRVIAASAAGQEIETTLEMVCQELVQILNVSQAAAGLLNKDKTEATIVAEYQVGNRPPLRKRSIPVSPIPAVQQLLEQKVPLVVDDAQNNPQLEPIHGLAQERGVVSLLLVPLIVEGEVQGGLIFGAAESTPFSRPKVNLAQRVAEQISGSLARARLEEQYRQAQKMEALGRLAGGVAHDFNNLLTVIQFSTQLQERTLHPDDPLWEHVQSIRETVERASRLTGQLLSFSRRDVVRTQALDLGQVIHNTRRMLQRIVGQDIHLAIKLADDLWPVRVAPSQIDQVLVNLAVNARDAMPEGGSLSIETSNVVLDQSYTALHVEAQPGEHVLLAVSDTGLGMDDEVQARIFEPFFTTKERGKGTGLGLATVFGIVKQSGGHIHVYSEVGQGTTFKIYLPRSQPAETVVPLPARALPATAAPSVRGTETVLLVEDEAPVRELAGRVLESCGYRVLTAGDGLQALQIGHKHTGPIHLLLTDVMLPQMNGGELAQELQSVWPEMKVLYMSGYTDNAIAQQGVLDPGVAFLSKPFTIEKLTRRTREVLDQEA